MKNLFHSPRSVNINTTINYVTYFQMRKSRRCFNKMQILFENLFPMCTKEVMLICQISHRVDRCHRVFRAAYKCLSSFPLFQIQVAKYQNIHSCKYISKSHQENETSRIVSSKTSFISLLNKQST